MSHGPTEIAKYLEEEEKKGWITIRYSRFWSMVSSFLFSKDWHREQRWWEKNEKK